MKTNCNNAICIDQDRLPLAGLCILIVLSLLFFPEIAQAQDATEFYRQNCMSCHTIGGGRLAGPDLKNVEQRKDRAWLARFMLDPKGVIDGGDAYALELQKEARGAIMPTIVGLTKSRAEQLLDLIAAESELPKSQFVGVQISDRPFTPKDVELGKRLFTGAVALANGGAACISCHGVHGIGGFGGGALAPDLTTVFERYEGRKALSTWLTAPATPTMQAVFRARPLDAEEVLALTAYFQYTLQRNPEDAATARLNFVLIGLGGTLLVLGLFDVLWNKRFRAVRRPLVNAKRAEILHEQ